MAKWWQNPEVAKKSAAAKEKAWKNFLKHFPKAEKSRFVSEPHFDGKLNATAEVFFKEGDGNLKSVLGSDRKTWSVEMKRALGLGDSGGFPFQLSPRSSKGSLPLPAEPFEGKAASLKKIFNAKTKIFVTPDRFFTTKFREIFLRTKLRHTSGRESKHWLAGPDMKYWPQQLNFAVFCATQGCGVSREIFDEGLDLPPQVRAFFVFHVYFTIRRILWQIGGIQSISALPGDPTFSQFNNHFDIASFKRVCAEFGVDPSSDFRFTHGANNGLGSVFVYAGGPTKTDFVYPGSNKFSDEGGKADKGNLIYFIEQGSASEAQFDWFCPNTATGLTQAGLSRVNQSIEAFVYCVLGAQVNVRSGILGEGGRAKEAQSEFLVLLEDAIRQPDLAKSVQRYQLAIIEAKVRLNLAVAPMAWLMPAKMLINTESAIGYNNKLKQAVTGMKLGVNNDANQSTKKAALQLMAPENPKVDRPFSHPSNPLSTKARDPPPPAEPDPKPEPDLEPKTEQHEINKTALIIGTVGLALLVLLAR